LTALGRLHGLGKFLLLLYEFGKGRSDLIGVLAHFLVAGQNFSGLFLQAFRTITQLYPLLFLGDDLEMLGDGDGVLDIPVFKLSIADVGEKFR